MTILAIDTATVTSSVAVATEERLLAEVTAGARLTHSETLQPHIAEALSMAETGRGDIEAVAVSIGPGSFTGLRIGLAAAKGMAYALRVPIVGVPTLAALAANLPVGGIILAPIIDAQKGNVYMAMYEWRAGLLTELSAAAVMPLASAVGRCGSAELPAVLMGDAAQKKLAGRELPPNVSLAPMTHMMPRASSVARVAFSMIARGDIGSVMDMEPFYIRRSEAEVLWEARQGKAADDRDP